jgi:hypothetical protein
MTEGRIRIIEIEICILNSARTANRILLEVID